jgi:NitT/TauT family transport system substrate-binding protein
MLEARYASGLLAALLLAILAAACSALPGASAREATTIRIAKQPGLGYLGLIVMREQKLLEKYAPGVKVEWNELTSGPAIRDAMIANQLDVGSGGTAPFIQGFDKGIKWKIAGALNDMPLYLNVNKESIKSLKDFDPNDKIALPAPGSIQHITLQMAAEKELGDPKKLDNIIVAMAHPDGQAALLSKKEITGHFTSPPFQYEELKDSGIHRVLNSYDVVGGPHTFNLTWITEDFKNKNPKLYKAYVDTLTEATDYINSNPEDTARLFVEGEQSKLSAQDILGQMKSEGIRFSMTPTGLMKYADFMKRTGVIQNVPASWKDYAFENLHGLSGS